MKHLEDLNEVEMRDLTTGILNAIRAMLPNQEVGFYVSFWPVGNHGVAQYGSNCPRPDMIKALRALADRLEKRQDVPR